MTRNTPRAQAALLKCARQQVVARVAAAAAAIHAAELSIQALLAEPSSTGRWKRHHAAVRALGAARTERTQALAQLAAVDEMAGHVADQIEAEVMAQLQGPGRLLATA